MQIRQTSVANSQGIHCRPSAVLVKEFQGYSGRIRISNGKGSCDVSSVMQLLSLEMSQGCPVKIEVMGDNEAATADRLVALFQTHFDFPPI
jgi:phosphotransferase system HPr (HPr) family protein